MRIAANKVLFNIIHFSVRACNVNAEALFSVPPVWTKMIIKHHNVLKQKQELLWAIVSIRVDRFALTIYIQESEDDKVKQVFSCGLVFNGFSIVMVNS